MRGNLRDSACGIEGGVSSVSGRAAPWLGRRVRGERRSHRRIDCEGLPYCAFALRTQASKCGVTQAASTAGAEVGSSTPRSI